MELDNAASIETSLSMYVHVVSHLYISLRNVVNANGESICIARVTLEEFAPSTCVTVALHSPTAVRNTWCASTERLSTLIKCAEILLAIALAGVSFVRYMDPIQYRCLATSYNSCIIIPCHRPIKIFGFNGTVYLALGIGYFLLNFLCDLGRFSTLYIHYHRYRRLIS